MKVTNIGDRVVCVGNVIIMPDQVVELGPEWENNPSILMLAHKEFIKIELDAPKAAPVEHKKAKTEPAATEAESETEPAPKPVRKKRKAAADSE